MSDLLDEVLAAYGGRGAVVEELLDTPAAEYTSSFTEVSGPTIPTTG